MAKKNAPKNANIYLSNPLAFFLAITLSILAILMYPYISDIYTLPKATFLYIAALGLLFIFLMRLLKEEKIVIYRSVLDIPVLLYVIIAIVSLVFSDNPILGLVGKYKRYEGLPSVLSYALIYFISVQAIREEKDFESYIKILALGFIPVAFYGFLQTLGYDFPTVTRFESRVHSSFGNPIVYGAYLVLIIPLFAGLARNAREEGWRILSWVLILVAIFNVIVTESRGAWLGLVASAIVALLVRFGRAKKRSQIAASVKRQGYKQSKHKASKKGSLGNQRIIITIAIVSIILILTIALVLPLSHLFDRITSVFLFGEGSVATRLETWKSAIAMIKNKPIFGFGLEQMGYWFPTYATEKYQTIAPNGVADRTHNDFLQTAVDIGLPGLVVYLWIILIAVTHLWRIQTNRKFVYITASVSSLAGYFAQAQTGIPAVFISPFVWSLIGASVSYSGNHKSLVISFPKWLKPRAFIFILGALFFAVSVFAVMPIIADKYIYNGQQKVKLAQSIDYLGLAAPDFDAAIKIFPYQNEYNKLACEFYLDYASAIKNDVFAQNAVLIAKRGLQYNNRDFELSYYVAEADFLSYRLTENINYLAEAKQYFKRTLELRPNSSFAITRLMQASYLQGDKENALNLAKELVKQGIDDPDAYLILAKNAKELGNNKKAEEYLNVIKSLPEEARMRAVLR